MIYKLRIVFISVLVFSISFQLLARDNWNECYYENAKEGTLNFECEKYDLAIFHLKKALKCGKGFPHDYYKLAVSYSKQNRLKNCNKICEKLILDFGFEISSIKVDTNLTNYTNSNYYKRLNAHYIRYRKQYNCSLDADLMKTFVGMVESDIFARDLWSAYDYDTSLTFIASSVDSINTEKLIKLLKNDDNIGYNKLGKYSSQIFFLMLHVTSDGVDDESQFVFFENYLRKNVEAFNFNPVLYSIFIDKTLVQLLNKKQKYGSYWEFNKGVMLITDIENIQKVDLLRKEVYLMPLWIQYYDSKQFQFINEYPYENKRFSTH